VIALREGMGKKPNLFYMPNFVMKFAAVCIGKHKLYEQLFSSLEIDSSKAQTLLGWQPPLDITLSLQHVGQTYNKSK
jgi:nucleoside-diphosphate-sugar epimerase